MIKWFGSDCVGGGGVGYDDSKVDSNCWIRRVINGIRTDSRESAGQLET